MTQNKISQKNSYVILVLTFISIVSCIIFEVSLVYGFISSLVFGCLAFIRIGFTITELLNMMKSSLTECKELFILILLIGSAIPIWFSSGVIPTMMYYGFQYMQKMNIVFAAFILTSIVSIFMGSAFGAISTIGIALLGLGKMFGIPDYILLGAIVSGSFLADKLSPISGLLNLTLATTKTSYRGILISMFKTLLPTYIASGIIYFYIGKSYSLVSSGTNLEYFESTIKTSFFISPLLLILPISVFILSFLGVKIIKALSLGLICGIIVTLKLQKLSFIKIILAIFIGYRGETSSVQLNKILAGGGVISMVEVLLIIVGAIALNSIFQGTGIISPILNKITSTAKSKGKLILNTGIVSSILTIACDQSVGIIISGDFLKKRYKELGINNDILARTISDTGTIIAPLVPWNVNSLFILVITGISTVKYAPYAVLCYALPITTLFVVCIYKFRYDVEV